LEVPSLEIPQVVQAVPAAPPPAETAKPAEVVRPEGPPAKTAVPAAPLPAETVKPAPAVRPKEPPAGGGAKPAIAPKPAPVSALATKEESIKKTKRRSGVAVFVIVALLLAGGVVTALYILRDIGEVGLEPVLTMPEIAPTVPSQSYSLPAPGPMAQPQGSAPTSSSPAAPSQQPAAAPSSALPAPSMGDRIAEPIQEAIRFVKGYRLDPGRGTIANWFDSQFLTSPGDGREPEWSAVHLADSKFTVQYRLSHTNRPPHIPEIYYVFEVDLAARTIQGQNEAAKALLAGGRSTPKTPRQRADETPAGVGVPIEPQQGQATPAAPSQTTPQPASPGQ